jgi:DNA-binding NarL/FixJ family response regulator
VHSATAARAALRAGDPGGPSPIDWVFLDMRLPDDPDHSLLAELREGPWAARSIIISAELPREALRLALARGMRGFIPKAADPAMVLAGFEAVRRGEVYLPPELAELRHPAPAGSGSPNGDDRSLSPRLREVLALVLRGASNKVIAREMGLSEHTVKEYMSAILAHHGVGNRLELVLKLKGGTASG